MKKIKYLKTVNNRPTDKQLDNLWRECCLARDGYLCRYTKELYKTELNKNNAVLQVHHIMEKATNRLRWDLNNGITIVKDVHFGIAHAKSPTPRNQFREWALDRLTRKERKDLEFIDRQKGTGGVDRFALKIYLEQKLNEFSCEF